METKVNYTQEQTTEIVRGYQSGVTVEQLSHQVGKSVRSVVAKLVREGVYVAKTRPAGTRTSKATMIAQIAQLATLDPAALGGLERAPREALESLLVALTLNHSDPKPH